MASNDWIYPMVLILMIVLLGGILCAYSSNSEYFDAVGLTNTLPPSWWTPKTGYDRRSWETEMYLQRYPWDGLTSEETDRVASVYPFWRN